MSWSTRTFFTAPLREAEAAISASLPGFRLGERLERLDRMRPSVEWWTLPVRGGMLDEVVHVSVINIHPGTRVMLRAPTLAVRLARGLTARVGGFGGVLVQDQAQCRFGRGLAFAGTVVEACERDLDRIRLDLGRPAGVDDAARLASLEPVANQAHWLDWLEWITGLTTFDLDQAMVRRPPRRFLYALEPEGTVSDGWEPVAATSRTIVGMFIDPEMWEAVQPAIPSEWTARIRLTPPRLDLDTFKPRTMSYAIAQCEGPMDLESLDAVMRQARCDATAVQVAGDGQPVGWWDWEKGAPAHAGEVLGAADFVEVWAALAVALDTNPHVFTAPWSTLTPA